MRWLALPLILCACMPETEEPGPHMLSDDARAACLADGGTPVRGFAGETCAAPTPDAGTSCTSGSQCSGGLCIREDEAADSPAQCAPLDVMFGCHPLLEDGQPVTICID